MCPTGTDRKSILSVVGLSPPTIQNRTVQSAIQNYLLSTGARSFQRPSRVIEPHIDALYQNTSHLDRVILKNKHPSSEWLFSGQLENMLQNLLASIISRVSFPCKNELQRAICICDQLGQEIQIFQDQVRSLIRRKTSCESNCQGLWIKQAFHVGNDLSTLPTKLCLINRMLSCIVDQTALQCRMDLP